MGYKTTHTANKRMQLLDEVFGLHHIGFERHKKGLASHVYLVERIEKIG
jgi:hypothetical protein